MKRKIGQMVVAACVAGMAGLAEAADRVWTGGGALPNWSASENWSGGTPPSAGDRPVFSGTTGLTANNDFVWNLSFAGLLFAETAGAFTVGGNPIALGGDITNLSASAQSIALDMALPGNRILSTDTGDITVSGRFTGAGGLTKAGTGTALLAGPNSYTGPTRIDAGTLAVTTAVSVALDRVGQPPLWFDAMDSGTLTVSGGRVTVWANKGSIASMNAAVPSGFAGPLLVTSTYAGGRQMLRLDGSNQGLVTVGNTGISGTASRTLFVVCYRAAGSTILVHMGNTADNQSFGLADQADKVYWYAYGSGRDITKTASEGNVPHVYSFVASSATNVREGFDNGVSCGTLGTAMATANTPLYLGYRSNNTSTRGDIGEVIVYNRALTSAERQEVESYLMTKWLGAVPSAEVCALPPNASVGIASGATLRVDAGTASVAAFDTSAAAAIALADAAELLVTATNAQSLAAAVTGAGGVTKRGSHTLTLSGANGYTGPTAVHGGSLIVEGLADGGLPSPVGASPSDPSNLVLGAGTLKLTGTGCASDRGLLIAVEAANKASTLWTAGDVTLSGRVACERGAFIKSGPGTLAFTGAGENLFSTNASYNGSAQLNPGDNGDAPTQGFSGLNVAEGKLVLGAEGQTNRFMGEFFVGIRQAVAKAAELEINGGVTTGTTWLAVGRGDGTEGISSKITVNAGELVAQSFSMGYSVGLSNFWSRPVLNVNGGFFRIRDFFYLGESAGATAAVNVAGGTLRAEADIVCGRYAGASGALNLLGGTVEARNIVRDSGAGRVLFDGGVLRPLVSGQTLQNLDAAEVGAGGARFDTSLADYTLNQPLLHRAGLPGADGGLVKLASGTLTFASTNSTYTGPTLVSGGTLRLTGTPPAAVTVADGATFLYARSGAANDMGAVTLHGGATFGPTPPALLQLNGTSLAVAPGSAVLATNGAAQTLAFSGALTLGAPSAEPVTLVLDVAADGSACDRLTTAGTLTLGAVDVNLRRTGSAFPHALNGTLRLMACPAAQTPDISGLAVTGGASGKRYTFGTATDGGLKWVTVTIANDYAGATIWTNAAGGAWSVDANWSVPPTGAVGSAVRFDDAVAAPAEIVLDAAAQTVGALYFNNANGYTLAGTETLTLDNGGAPALAVVERGFHAVAHPLALAGGLDVRPAPGTGLTLASALSGSGALCVADAGTLHLTGTNQTGAIEVSDGTLKIDAPDVLGGSAATVTLQGGTLETTASMSLAGGGQAAILVGAAGGTIRQPAGATLTLGGGAVGGKGRLTLENGTLIPGGAIGAGAFALNNLTFRNSTSSALDLGQPVAFGGTVAVETSPADVTLSGPVGQSAGKGATVFTKRGTGTLTVAAAGNWSSAGQRASVNVEEGVLRFAHTLTNSVDVDSGTQQSMYVGTAAGKQAVLRVEPGAALTLRNDLRAGAVVGATGVVEIAGGTVNAGWLSVAPGNNMNGVVRVGGGGALRHLRNAAEIGLGGYNTTDTGAYAYLHVADGGLIDFSLYSGQNFQIGRYGNARMDIAGGTVRCRSWTCLGRFASGFGELNIRDGGLLEHVAENVFGVAEQGRGTVNVSDGGVLRASNFAGSNYGMYLSLNNAGTQRTVVNLWRGGAVEPTRLVASAAGSTVYNSVNFHGGILRAYTNNAVDFLRLRIAGTDTARAYVWPEGAVIDSNGKNVTIPEPLVAPAGQGVASVVVIGGGRYLAPPLLWLNGGGGVGATASAVLDEEGAITNVFVTNPGTGYTSAPTVEIRGGAPGAPAVLGTVALKANASGGLVKQGAGTLTLTGEGCSYTGATVVAAGTLRAASNVLAATEGYLVGTNAVFDLAGTAHAVGLLGGDGTVSNGAVAVAGRLSPGDAPGVAGTLTVYGDARLATGSTFIFDCADTARDRLAVAGNLTINGGGYVDLGRTEANPLETPFEAPAMTFTGSCDTPSGVWRVRNSGRPNAFLVANFEVRGNTVYVVVRYSGTLFMLK
jgi:autotransporter-associated beta strand protein